MKIIFAIVQESSKELRSRSALTYYFLGFGLFVQLLANDKKVEKFALLLFMFPTPC